ncbi:amino acid/polyamine transporter I [Microdochium trichocladiopsis]|uniref:Amino acid/polyamine transporter I n=1 Tax=Microdochium trichocladiopsis TaxID=1682393 RepID=A0A9P9BR76_9PEZI|nr:amino acid/polyamine transporter I [Microdochium trichocladiopsis]KAH7026622.1 amino acid/polyamine transporter I [Microdochium trichocladiopsis]
MGSVTVVAAHGVSSSPRDDASVLEKQTRTRKLFTLPQLYAFSLMYLVTWIAMGSSMYYGLLNGGPVAFLFNYLIVVIGALTQAACLAELASILPIAGAQYYWTYYLATPNTKMFVTWMQGWATWLGYVFFLATCLNSNTVLLHGVIQINNPEYEATGWRTCLIIIATLGLYTAINLWGFRSVPWIELVAGILNICFFIITVAALWMLSPRNGPEFFLTMSSASGYENSFVSWNVGMLTHLWTFISFEGIIHMGEETKDAKRVVPKAMVWAIATNGVTGLIAVVTFLACMPPVEDMLSSSSPFIYLIVTSTGSVTVATVIGTGVSIALMCAGMTVYSSASRLTWAWARDGGLPSYFGHVDAKTRVPLRAVLLTCAIVVVLNFLNLGTETYVALGAITSLATLAIYFSYAIILSIVLYARLTTGFQVGQWNLGRWGLPLNVYSLVHTLYTMIWLPFPTTVPVTATTMNYSGPVFGAVMIGAIGMWYAWGKKHWPGPNQKVVEIVLRLAGE